MRTQDSIQSVQRQVRNIDRSHNMQIFQEWNTFRGSRSTLLSDPAAKLIRIKAHVFSDSPDPSSTWATTLEDASNEHGYLSNNRSAILLARTTRCFFHSNQESFSGIFERANSIHRDLFAHCPRCGSICNPFRARTLVLPGARVRKYVLERKLQQTSRTLICGRIADG